MGLEELKEHRKQMLEDYLYMSVTDAQAPHDYYNQATSRFRENMDQRSQSQINMHLLKFRIDGLVQLRDNTSDCIKYLEGLDTARINMGCGDAST
jgi:hypothetical protein